MCQNLTIVIYQYAISKGLSIRHKMPMGKDNSYFRFMFSIWFMLKKNFNKSFSISMAHFFFSHFFRFFNSIIYPIWWIWQINIHICYVEMRIGKNTNFLQTIICIESKKAILQVHFAVDFHMCVCVCCQKENWSKWLRIYFENLINLHVYQNRIVVWMFTQVHFNETSKWIEQMKLNLVDNKKFSTSCTRTLFFILFFKRNYQSFRAHTINESIQIQKNRKKISSKAFESKWKELKWLYLSRRGTKLTKQIMKSMIHTERQAEVTKKKYAEIVDA